MTDHSIHCPADWEAKRQGRRDADRDTQFGYPDPYRRPYGNCDDGNRAWRRGYEDQLLIHDEERQSERRRQRIREEHEREEQAMQEMWAQEQQARDEEAAYYAEQEEWYWMQIIATHTYQAFLP